jgi:hypothetical protein
MTRREGSSHVSLSLFRFTRQQAPRVEPPRRSCRPAAEFSARYSYYGRDGLILGDQPRVIAERVADLFTVHPRPATNECLQWSERHERTAPLRVRGAHAVESYNLREFRLQHQRHPRPAVPFLYSNACSTRDDELWVASRSVPRFPIVPHESSIPLHHHVAAFSEMKREREREREREISLDPAPESK